MVNLLLQGIERAAFVAIVAERSLMASGKPESPVSSPEVSSEPRSSTADSGAGEPPRLKTGVGLSESLGSSPTEQGIRVLHWDSRNLTDISFA